MKKVLWLAHVSRVPIENQQGANVDSQKARTKQRRVNAQRQDQENSIKVAL